MAGSRWNVGVDQIPEDGLDLHLSELSSFFDFNQEDVSWREPIEWSGTIQRFGADIYCRGASRAEIALPCSRCLKDVALALEVGATFSFIPARSAGGEGNEEVEAASEEPDMYLYDGGEVALREPVRDSLIMAVPLQPFCREDCQGLCSRCGADLNDGPCGCAPEAVDPRWGALARLRGPLSTEKG
jgi:uncharacterized protein